MNILQVYTIICFCTIQTVFSQGKCNLNQPHIVLIIADDVGWNDVGFHGSNQIPTPNIDALAYNGVILNRFYTQQACTPSRTALLTGQYPMRLGMQGIPIIAGHNRHLPLDIPILPEKLKELGYTTQLIGKWHLGAAYKNVTPIERGFDHHLGYWHGYIGYFNHHVRGESFTGLDMHENFEPVWDTQGEYVTQLLTRKTEEVIRMHNESKPLFLMLAHLAGHAGNNGADLEVPDVKENNKKFGYIADDKRRLYAGMISELDKSVGSVVEALSKKGILDNTLIIFFSDNGAQTEGLHENAGSNWPLRGLKFTLLDGGVRNIAVVYSSQLKNKGIVSNELIHITDLLPTIYSAAGGDAKNLGKIDGINQWPTLVSSIKSKRSELLLNIDEINNSSGLISENGRYKLINGSTVFETYDRFYGEDGRNSLSPPYDTAAVLNSPTNTAIGGDLSQDKLLQLRSEADLGNCRHFCQKYDACRYNNFCLFDLLEDPCETTNIAKDLPEIVVKLSGELREYWKQIQPQKITFLDPKANPSHFNNTWYTWLENDYVMS